MFIAVPDVFLQYAYLKRGQKIDDVFCSTPVGSSASKGGQKRYDVVLFIPSRPVHYLSSMAGEAKNVRSRWGAGENTGISTVSTLGIPVNM